MPYSPIYDITEVNFIVGTPITQDCVNVTVVGYDLINKKSYRLYNDEWIEYADFEVLEPTFSAASLSGKALKKAFDAL